MPRANRIKTKNVGAVRIFEMMGNFSGTFATIGKRALKQSIRSSLKRNILFNLEATKSLDAAGIEAILKSSDEQTKCGLFTRNPQIREMLQAHDKNHRMEYFDDEFGVVRYFAREFATPITDTQTLSDRRQFVRLFTVLPVRFGCVLDNDSRIEFFAVVTNLSEGGLFAEFIQSKVEEQAHLLLNPYDLPLLKLDLCLPGKDNLQLQGKLIHGDINEIGTGIEFYGLDGKNRNTIRDWIAEHLAQFQATH